MKMKSGLAVVASLLLAGSAQATLVAGWGFEQNNGAGTIGAFAGFVPENTISANYSDFDPNGLGLESGNFGTLWMDGSFGSDVITNGDFNIATDELVIAGLGFTQNNDEPGVYSGLMGDLASLGTFGAEGICFDGGATCGGANTLQANLAFDAVFQADAGAGQAGTDWVLEFAKGSVLAGTTDVEVSWGFDGVTYANSQIVSMTDTEALQTINLGGVDEQDVFVRFSFTDTTYFPNIDNVTLAATVNAVPEPGTILLGLAGALGLAVFGRRES